MINWSNSHRHLMQNLLIGGIVLGTCGCEGLIDIFLPKSVRVSLVNRAEFDVEGSLFIDGEQAIPEFLLIEIGNEIEFTVAPGETVSFTRDCDALQAILIADADLRIVGGLGPEASTSVLRDGEDFGCGDQIIFSFSHSAAIVDFDISTLIR